MKALTPVRVVEAEGTQYYMSGAPMSSIGWTIINTASKEEADKPTVMLEEQYDSILGEAVASYSEEISQAKRMILILLIVVVFLSISSALVLSKRIVKPLNTMTRTMETLSVTREQFRMEDTYRTGDEIEVLAEKFASLSARTIHYVGQVKKVTAEKERIKSELGMATAIQVSQLPHLFPAFPDRKEFDIYASMTPAKEVGGDFYDFFMLDEDHLGLVMADVSGKGVPAALFMVIAKTLIKNRAQMGGSPAEVLAYVNEQLCEGNDAELFVTVWFAILELSTGKGIAANAGHEHPVLRRSGGDYELVVYRHSPAVATLPGIRFREHEFELHPGDRVFVYTDGVPEAINVKEEDYGSDRMLAALNSCPPDTPMKETLRLVREDLDRFAGEMPQFDDVTMMAIDYKGPTEA
jgi:sigma-B regulation protein RsbU (phosphoserine phosphatase)